MFSLIPSDQHWLIKLGGFLNAFITSLGGLGVMFLAIADSSFLSLPEGNDLLIVILSAGQSWLRMAYFVGMTVLGSAIGCWLLYSVGRKGGSPILRRKFSQESVNRAEKLFNRYGILTILIPSILPPPTPFKFFVLAAGVFRLKRMAFLTSVVIGRTLRYSLWGILAVLYGNSVKFYIQQNLSIVGTVLLACFVLGLAITLFYYYRRLRLGGTGN